MTILFNTPSTNVSNMSDKEFAIYLAARARDREITALVDTVLKDAPKINNSKGK